MKINVVAELMGFGTRAEKEGMLGSVNFHRPAVGKSPVGSVKECFPGTS